jgi:cytidine deaminase
MTAEELMALAEEAAARAYAPYSKALVGCALIAESGAIYRGCNVENASYGLTICAERNAIFAGVAAEGPAFRIARLAVIARGLEFPPCGACRQVIAEFAGDAVPVSFMSGGKLVALTVAGLLPASFSFRAAPQS